MREHEPDTAGRHASLLLHLPSYSFTDDTRGSLDTLNFSSRSMKPAREQQLSNLCKVALVQRAVKDAELLNHLVMHAGRPSTYTLVREEVRLILITRASQAATPQAMNAESNVRQAKTKAKTARASLIRMRERAKDVTKPDKELQCFYCDNKKHREHKPGQEELTEEAPGLECEAHEEDTRCWILTLGLESQLGDGHSDGVEVLRGSGAALSTCPLQFCASANVNATPRAAVSRAADGA